jgi:RNA polymerase sigma-70 factor (ECF subfamily)
MFDRVYAGWTHGMANGQIPEFELASLLAQCSEGDRQAFGEVFTHLYRDIHDIARRELRGERHLTIRPTALVNEAFMRMQGLREIRWQDRAHVLAMASRITRQVLVDGARRRRAEKRNGGDAVTLSDENLGGVEVNHDALDVDKLLTELESFDAIAAQVVSLRVFGGLSIEETAQHLEVSIATVNRRWSAGKSWLMRELSRV